MAKRKTNHLLNIKLLSGRKDILQEVKVPKKRKAVKKRVRTTVKNVMEEKDLEKKIIFALKRSGYWVHKTSQGGAYCYNTQYNQSGIADLHVYGLPNKVTMLEVKTNKGKQRRSQKEFQDFCEKIGIKYVIVRSVTDALFAVENK